MSRSVNSGKRRRPPVRRLVRQRRICASGVTSWRIAGVAAALGINAGCGGGRVAAAATLWRAERLHRGNARGAVSASLRRLCVRPRAPLTRAPWRVTISVNGV